MRHTTIAIAAALLAVAAGTVSVAVPNARAGDCSDYRNELLVARSELQRGDRGAAVAALRRAKAALRACGEESSGDRDPTPHAGSDRTTVG
jgi:hypothetical protein